MFVYKFHPKYERAFGAGAQILCMENKKVPLGGQNTGMENKNVPLGGPQILCTFHVLIFSD